MSSLLPQEADWAVKEQQQTKDIGGKRKKNNDPTFKRHVNEPKGVFISLPSVVLHVTWEGR